MRGFLTGSLALIVLYVAVQPGTAAKAETGSNVLVQLLNRALSPQVAGLPQRGGKTVTRTLTPNPTIRVPHPISGPSNASPGRR